MEAKTKKNLIVWGVVLLVLLNVTSLSTIWYHRYQFDNNRIDRRNSVKSMNQHKKMQSKHESRRTSYISRGLDLSPSQQDKFDSIWNQYSAIRKDVEKEMENNRQKMSFLMSDIDIDTNKFNKLSVNQGILMQELDHSMISMNLALRTNLTDEQLKAFLTKVETMSKRMRSRSQPGERMRKRTK
jgi:Spy/CpxP family protein refolding chaperone